MPQIHEAPVALHEVAVHFRGKPAFFEQARAVGRTILAVARQPAQRIGVELIARIFAGVIAGAGASGSGAHLLDDAVALQREEQEPDDLAGVRAPEGLRPGLLPGLPRRRIRFEGAFHVLSVGAVRGDEEAAPFALPSRAGPGDDGAGQLTLVVEIPDRAFEETWLRLLDEIVLFPGVEHVHLHCERPPEHVEQGADDLLPRFGRDLAEGRRSFDEAPVPAAFLYGEPRLPQFRFAEQSVFPSESFVLETQQPAVLQIGRGDPPAAFEVAVEEVLDDAPQGVPGVLPCRAAHFRIRRIVLETRVHGVEDVA